MPKTKTPAVSERNTKQEIFSAYQTLLTEISAESDGAVSVPEEQKILDNASKETVEKITTDLSSLKLSLNQTIAKLTERLTDEAERLEVLQKAIAIAQKELNDLSAVKLRAGMLEAMIRVQQEREEAFEKEMTAKRQIWETEQHDYEEKINRDRARNEEEYAYAQTLLKKHDSDEREAAKYQAQREFTEEKEARTAQLKELEDLRKRAAQFPVELEKTVKEAVATALTNAKHEAESAAQFAKQKADGELQLAGLKIEQLGETVKAQSAEISRLNRELSEATRQVKDIAVTLVSGQHKETTSSTKPGEENK